MFREHDFDAILRLVAPCLSQAEVNMEVILTMTVKLIDTSTKAFLV